ncbi:MAG TPA: class I SAM-dependent methyltransferase [Opitutaceae bacterium]
MKHLECPSCRREHIGDFFRVPNAPIQSLVAIKEREQALAIPRRDIDLCFCSHCGFVFNSSFDTSYDYYTRGYEDQQGFSPTFRRFISEVTTRFIERYDMKDKAVVEIGCGKGDFISLFCELGHNRGVGIDPAWVPGRTAPSPNVRFIPEFYSERHGELEADCICCRHTLEHIHDVNTFLRTIRQSVGDREDVILFIEVPSIVRILKTQAFWDIFNEHCSYFSPGSLARLLRAHRFEILDLYLAYDDQYLFVEARPVKTRSDRIHPLEESVEALHGLTKLFSARIAENLGRWDTRLRELKSRGAKTVLWGGGSKAVGFLTHFDHLGAIEHVVDINPHMEGNYIPGIGKRYVQPAFLADYRPDAVVILNGVYQKEIAAMLEGMNLRPQLFAL